MIASSLIYLTGGVGLFLYGMKIMGEGLELAAGSRLKKMLEVLTKNKWLAAFVGFIVTAIIQSSAATTVMVLGFINAQLISLGQAVGVIMGANIGTTVTGLIIALDLKAIAPIVLLLGVILIVFQKKKMLKHIGMILAGFGFLFLGLQIMGDAMEPIRDLPFITELFKYTANPLFGILVGIILTVMLQSSSAAMGILLAMVSAGIITGLDQAIYILYGQNIGTCFTTIFASIGANLNAKRAAIIHLLFNVLGTVIFTIITMLPLNFGFVQLMQALTEDTGMQLAYTHLVFNIVTTLILLPLSNYLVRLVELLVRGKNSKEVSHFNYIDNRILTTPPIAVMQTHKEVERMGKIALENYNSAIDFLLNPPNSSEKVIEKNIENEQTLDYLNGEITQYLVKTSMLELENEDANTIGSLFHVVSDFERIGDHSKNIIEQQDECIREIRKFSDKASEELEDISNEIRNNLQLAIEMFEDKEFDIEKMRKIKETEDRIDQKAELYKNNHIIRLNREECNVYSGVAFTKILTDLERIGDHANNIAKSNRYKKAKGEETEEEIRVRSNLVGS